MVLLPEGVAGKWFKAHDKGTGAVVADVELPGGVSGQPNYYMGNGRQYVGMPIAWSGMTSEWVAPALP